MRPLATLVVLCTVLFVTLYAAPVLPSGLETFEKQQLEEMMHIPKFFSKILAAGGNRAGTRGGSIQADNGLAIGQAFLNVASSLLSAVSKKADPSNELQQTFFNGFSSILPLIGQHLGDEGGEIQSEDEMPQPIINLFGTLFSGMTEKTENGEVHAQSASNKEMEQKLLNDARNLIAALSRNAIDPNSEVIQTFINGANTIFSLIEKLLESGGEVQSSDSEVKQALMNFVVSFFSWLRKILNDTYGEVQLANDDEFRRTAFNVMKILVSAIYRNVSHANPNNEMLTKLYNWIDTLLPILADVGERDHERVQRGMNQFGSFLSAITKDIENGKFHFTSKAGPAIWKILSNLFSVLSKNIDPDDDASLSFSNHVSTFLSAIGRMINGDGGSQIQSDIDNELLKTVLNFIGGISSDYQKKAKPKDIEFAQPVFTLFNAILSAVKNKIGGGAQEVHVDTLPT